jgi:hypothetical protein
LTAVTAEISPPALKAPWSPPQAEQQQVAHRPILQRITSQKNAY